MLPLVNKLMIKTQNLKLVIMFSIYKNVFAKDFNPTWSKDVFVIKKF